MPSRHAYLILAHNQFNLLQVLISSLDDERNDIFLHIDAKAETIPSLKTEKAGLFILNQRVNVHWGDISVVKAEFALFRAASARGGYSYYHLLSGADLPLKSQDYIHAFFEANDGKEFIGYHSLNITPEIVRKAQRWHIFPTHFRSDSLLYRIPRAFCLSIQEFFGIYRNRDIEWKKGTQWVSITEGLVNLLLENEEWTLERLHHTFCPDEIFLHTICWNSQFRNNIYDIENEGHGCLREIHWKNGELLDWKPEDYEYLKNSPALFARKFNADDTGLIEAVLKLSE